MSIINKPVGKSNLYSLKMHRTIMNIRANKRRKNMSLFQEKATEIIKKLTKKLNIEKYQCEKTVYCESINRFYLLDIYIPSLRLDIELDGKQHNSNRKYDINREDALLNDWGIVTIRFPNRQVSDGNFENIIKSVLIEQSQKNIKPLNKDLSLPLNWGFNYRLCLT